MLANGDQKTHFGPHGDQRGSSGWAPTPPQQPCPIPFSLSPCEPRLFWQNQLAELIFKKKKPRQNWSRDHFEATQKANFSILKPNFWSGDTAMGMAHWHNPKRVNFFSNILQNHYFVRWNSYFYQHFSGWLFFANFQTRISYFFTMGLSPCTAWVGDRYIGEVISPFRTLPWQKMTAQFQFFQSLPHKKADFVKKKAGRTWGIIIYICLSFQRGFPPHTWAEPGSTPRLPPFPCIPQTSAAPTKQPFQYAVSANNCNNNNN